MNAALDKDAFGGGGLEFSGPTSEGGLAPLDNPPFVMKPQRMGHPVCAGPEATADPCGMTTKKSKGKSRDIRGMMAKKSKGKSRDIRGMMAKKRKGNGRDNTLVRSIRN
jgi:hypothetical protein